MALEAAFNHIVIFLRFVWLQIRVSRDHSLTSYKLENTSTVPLTERSNNCVELQVEIRGFNLTFYME